MVAEFVCILFVGLVDVSYFEGNTNYVEVEVRIVTVTNAIKIRTLHRDEEYELSQVVIVASVVKYSEMETRKVGIL